MLAVQSSASLLWYFDDPLTVPMTARAGTILVVTPSASSAFGAAATSLAFLSSVSLAS